MLVSLLITKIWIASKQFGFPSGHQKILKPGLSEVRQDETNGSLGLSASSPYMYARTQETLPF